MAERHPNGFLEARRQPIGYRKPAVRMLDYNEIYAPRWDAGELRVQGGRCMDCGVPACMTGCPIANLIPDWNDLISRNRWRDALRRLHATNNFPEFTGYTCPAPCEPACVLSINDDAVTIKSIERAIVDKGWDEGWIVPEPPAQRSALAVAIVGSGPAGLAAAQQLNRAGHRVRVFERDDAIGGLMTYGIPDFKFAKWRVARRVEQLEAEGIEFVTGIDVGRDVSLADLRKSHDAVCLTIGALAPRPLDLPGRHLDGVVYAMEFLVQENRRQAGRRVEKEISAHDRRVVVLGGGDTGADCVATARRQGAASITQIDINLIRPERRAPENPWPEAPLTYEPTYAEAEGCSNEYGFETLAFEPDRTGRRVAAVLGQRVAWTYSRRRKRLDRIVVHPHERVQAELVLIAAGFAGPELLPFAAALATTDGGTIATDDEMRTNVPGVFAAGDARMGQSIVVWAIGEGRDVARAIDTHLTGGSALPASLRTPNPPIEWQSRGDDPA
jgi:NAD(P)H-dependent glutamate synthase small subunit